MLGKDESVWSARERKHVKGSTSRGTHTGKQVSDQICRQPAPP